MEHLQGVEPLMRHPAAPAQPAMSWDSERTGDGDTWEPGWELETTAVAQWGDQDLGDSVSLNSQRYFKHLQT